MWELILLICMVDDAFPLDTALILTQRSMTKLHTSPYIKQALATAIRYIMQIVPTAKFTTFLSTGQRSPMNCRYSFQERHEDTIQQNASLSFIHWNSFSLFWEAVQKGDSYDKSPEKLK